MGLYKMHVERISSIAVIDKQDNLLGNISVTDVKHVTRTSQYPLLHKTCRHFISVILNSRGLETGKDSFPIFHVYPSSSLARTLAKLVATKSHRLWIVQPPESSTSASSTNLTAANTAANAVSATAQSSANGATPMSKSSSSTSLNSHSPLMTAMEDPPSHVLRPSRSHHQVPPPQQTHQTYSKRNIERVS